MLPPFNHKEWQKLIISGEEPVISSHLFKIKVKTLRRMVRHSMISLEDATLELYEDCKVHYNIYKNDLHRIFKTDKVKRSF